VAVEVCREATGDEIVAPANLNSPQQIVVAGHRDAVRRAMELAKRRGAKRVVMLDVSAPFHSPLMRPAEERLAAELDRLQITDAQIPLVNNVGAQVVCSAQGIRDGLKRQVTSPVRWEESMARLRAEGVELFVEVGPGRVLTGLLRQIDRGAECLRVEDLASLNETVARCGLALTR